LVASCQSSSTKVAGTTVPPPSARSTTTTASTTTAAPSTDSVLAARASAAVLQTADFPPGFTPQPEDPQNGLQIETVWQDLTHCLGVDSTAAPGTLATSPTFQRGIATQARATVEYLSDSSAAAISAALAGPKFQGCMTSAFTTNAKRSAPQGATPGPSVVTPLNVPQVGQKMFASRINVTMNLTDLPIGIFQDFLFVFQGGALIRLWFLNPGSAFPPALEQTLIQKVVGRV